LACRDIDLIRVNCKEFYQDKEKLANRLEGLIDLLGED